MKNTTTAGDSVSFDIIDRKMAQECPRRRAPAPVVIDTDEFTGEPCECPYCGETVPADALTANEEIGHTVCPHCEERAIETYEGEHAGDTGPDQSDYMDDDR